MSGKLAPPALVKEIDADKKNMISNTVLWRLIGRDFTLSTHLMMLCGIEIYMYPNFHNNTNIFMVVREMSDKVISRVKVATCWGVYH